MPYRLILFCWIALIAGKSAIAQDVSVRFKNNTDSAQLSFQHNSPMSEHRHVHLTMGSGVGVCDFDRDGWPDLYFAQGGPWSGRISVPGQFRDELHRNNRGQFELIADTEVASGSYGMGVAVGDYNNDGFPDLYVSRFGADCLLHNNGDGTFSERKSALPPSTMSYSASCTWSDVNSDSIPDLFVSRYVNVSEGSYTVCQEKNGLHAVCPPWKYEGLHDVLLIQNSSGNFTDSSNEAGLTGVKSAQGLAVVSHDLDDDGDQDLYVANDSVPNHHWKNDGQGHFTEEGFFSGLAVNRGGKREAGMGVAIGVLKGMQNCDLVVTNYFAESNTYYRNEGFGLFLDVTDEIGVGAPSRSRLAFGINFLDAENDSDLDLFVANGHIHDRLKELGRDIPYRQRPQLLLNANRRFSDASDGAGEVFQKTYLGRGSATFDYNKDGWTDIVMTSLDENPVLLCNRTQSTNKGITVRLVGRDSIRDAYGAKLIVTTNEDRHQRFLHSSTSYLSTSEQLIHLGLGNSASVKSIEVRWPNGKVQQWHNVPKADRFTLVEGIERLFDCESGTD